ncbi:MAG: glycosyltransferase family 4 protein [Candidatus Omnitrophica bacterium]|nr:glycosyltransferase family 4 protein [Candidatus Omnitrophota bacterium]
MDKARHAFIVNDFPPIIGGQSSYLYYLCSALPPEKIVVLAPCCGNTSVFDRAQPFRIVRKPYLIDVQVLEKLAKILLPFFYVQRILRDEDIALLHCAHILSTGFIGLAMKVFRNIDYVLYTHSADILEYEHHPFFRPLLQEILSQAKHVVTNSRYTQGVLERLGVDAGKIVISSPRIDAADFGGLFCPDEVVRKYGLMGKRIILSINRLVPRKGNDVMIKAMPRILKRFPDAVYIVYGDGPCQMMLKDLVKELGLQMSVLFADPDDGDLRREWMAACEVFVMVSRAIEATGDVEGFGVVYLEAGAAGKPVVAGDSGGVPDAVEDGVNGFLVDPLDENAVAEAICRLLESQALAALLGAQGRERVKARFDYRRGVPELSDIFK